MTRRPLASRAVYGARWLAAQALYRTGVLGLLAGWRLRGRVVVLMYHRVLEPDAEAIAWSHPAIVVRRRTFELHMARLAARFRMIGLDELEAFLERGAPAGDSRPACLVTFDDGWIDTYREAWPVLAAQRVPALVFLPTQFIGAERMFWREALGRLLFDAWTQARTDPAFAARATPTLEAHGLAGLLRRAPEDIREAILQATQALRHQGEAEAPAVLTDVQALCAGTPRGETSDAFMNWAQVREMAAAGIRFGAHGVTHRILSTLPVAIAAREVADSRAAVSAGLGAHGGADSGPGVGPNHGGAVSSFSYPNGGWNPDVARAVRESGYKVAFSTDIGPVGPDADRFAIRRFNVHEDATSSWPMFLARLSGVL
jgi:peptidoglycan/xylan/chitin deacetylase (PgdA/CDA1 family)